MCVGHGNFAQNDLFWYEYLKKMLIYIAYNFLPYWKHVHTYQKQLETKIYWVWKIFKCLGRVFLGISHFTGKCASRLQTKVTIERTHQGLSTSEVWKSYWPWCRYSEVKCQLHIWPWNLELSRSRSQTKVPMERTHQGLSTSEVLKSYWPWSRYNEVKCQ